MVKRITAFLLTLVLISFGIVCYADFEQPARVSISKTTLALDNTVILGILVDLKNNPSVYSFDLTIEYDKEKFAPVSQYFKYPDDPDCCVSPSSIVSDAYCLVQRDATSKAGSVKIKLVQAKGFGLSGCWFTVKFKKFDNVTLEEKTEYPVTVAAVAATDTAKKPIIFDSEDGAIIFSSKPIYGDLNNDGVVNTVDALMVLKISVNAIMPTSDQKILGDVDGDKKISAADALMIMQKATYKRDKFPVENR